MAMHEGQLAIDLGQVRRLVAAQFPEWAGLHVRPVASSGTVSALFRIGDGLVARFPLLGSWSSLSRPVISTLRQAQGRPSSINEQRLDLALGGGGPS
jgi:aminoglycoside phosphotransferase (APT) family kinase protein